MLKSFQGPLDNTKGKVTQIGDGVSSGGKSAAAIIVYFSARDKGISNCISISVGKG